MSLDDIQVDTSTLEVFTQAMRRNGNDETLGAQARLVSDNAPSRSQGSYAVEAAGVGGELENYTAQLTRLYAQSALFFDNVRARFDESDYINM